MARGVLIISIDVGVLTIRKIGEVSPQHNNGGQKHLHLSLNWGQTLFLIPVLRGIQANNKERVIPAPAHSNIGNIPATAGANVSITNPLANVAATTSHENGAENKSSWTSLFKESPEQTFKIQYFKPDPKQRDIVSIPETTISQGSIGWENTIMGYFLDKKLPYSLVHNVATRLWKKQGLYDTLATDSGHFFFKFNSDVECDSVLEGGP